MSYRIEYIDPVQAAKTVVNEYQYALIYYYNKCILVNTSDLGEWDNTSCYEARFFDESGELRFSYDEEEIRAVRITDDEKAEDNTDSIIRKYELGNGIIRGKQYLLVKQYTDLDEDGQTVIKMTRLVGLE